MFPIPGIPNPYLILAAVLTVIAAFFAGDYHGYSGEHEKFLAFESQVKAAGDAQIAKNKILVAEQSEITKKTASDYETKITQIHQAYAGAQDVTVQAVTQSTKEGVSNDYESKIAALHRYYGDAVGRVFGASPGRSNVSCVPGAAPSIARPAPDAGLAERCAITTQQLISLQDWVKQQGAIQ